MTTALDISHRLDLKGNAIQARDMDLTGNLSVGGTTITNGVLPAGTATTAPLVFTTGTSLTVPAAGAAEFDGKVFYETALASSRQVVDTEQFIIANANSSTYNNTGLDAATTPTAVFTSPASGTLTVGAATTYMFSGLYRLSNTGTTSHTWATLFGGTATLTGIHYNVRAYTGATSAVTITAVSGLQVDVATQVPVTAASTSATEFVTVWLDGYVQINAAGTFIPQMQNSARPGASGTPGVIILNGSYFRMWPVGTNAIVSVGNWS